MRNRLVLVLLALVFAPTLVACSGSSSPSKSPGPSGGGSTAACTIPQNNGGDHDADNNGGPDDGDGCDR